MDLARARIEQTIMQRNFPTRHQFVNLNDPSQTYLDVGLQTTPGNAYRLKIEIAPDYPNSVPRAYIVYPRPDEFCDASGRPMYAYGVNHAMHLLTPKGKIVQLCHYKPQDWHPNVTLYKVTLKCLFWLEVYENHLQTGEPIDNFVNS